MIEYAGDGSAPGCAFMVGSYIIMVLIIVLLLASCFTKCNGFCVRF